MMLNFNRNFFFLFFFVLLINYNVHSQNIPLLVNGQSDYVIHLPSKPSSQCSKAVDELRIYLKKITGIQFTCSDKFFNKAKYIVFEDGYCSDSSFNINQLNKDGFRIKNNNASIFISALDGKGLLNAVYTFLEKYIGCRYYSADEIYIPKKNNILISNLTEDIQNPQFTFRTIHYYNAYQPEYAKLNKLNSSNEDRISSDWGGLWVHTMHKLLPPEKYFNTHPEYFALRNGIRVADQLCLSNPDVLNITVAALRDYMKKIPNARYWSVSQMDNFNYCECDDCRLIDSIEESPSGSIINFVNQVAANFPDKMISTLAYQYSRKAPKTLIPAENVNIMLCTIESDRNKPIAENYETGSFYDDLSYWSLISRNIIIWDYVTNFSHLVCPFPNYHVLQPNIQLFANYGATMIFEQGYAGKSGEMNELRCYLLAKLIWNPTENVDSLITDFLFGYYGKAAPFIRQYIDLSTSELLKSEKPLTLYEPPALHADDYLSAENLDKYFEILKLAAEAVKDDTTKRNRVEMVLQSIRYAWLEVCKYQIYADSWVFEKNPETNGFRIKPKANEILETFYKTAKKYGPSILHEINNPPDEYYRKTSDYFNNAIVNHKAVGKKISFEKQFSRAYKANGQNSLIDGIKGTSDYQVLWQGWFGDYINATIDLDSTENLSSVQISFVDDNQAWIMPPQSVEIKLSDDNVTYYTVASYINPDAGKKQDRQIVTFNIPFEKNANARYVNVKIKNIGKMPAWRGVNDNAWLFVDEIVVR